jgi:hypothetical protein
MSNGVQGGFAGLPQVRFDPAAELPADPSAVAWRLEVDDFDAPRERFAELLATFLDRVPPAEVRALVVGEWGAAYERPAPLELLVAAAARLTGLRALFLADLQSEQCEISWINHGDITPLLTAYAGLEGLRVRGANGLELRPVRHEALRELVFESGGLPAPVVRAVGDCDLPALRHLELWLGVDEYGGDATVADLGGVLSGARLPALRYLGLCNAEIADEIAAAVAAAPVVARLKVLDLSKGTLSDAGGEALLAAPGLAHLDRLDLHHHYLGESVQRRLVAALPGVEVDLSEEQEPDEYDGETSRYTAVAE